MRPADIFIAFILAMLAASASAATQSYYGEAEDLVTGKLLYREYHTVQYEGGIPVKRTVDYKNPQGELIAEKINIYADNPLTPSFNLIEPDTGYREALSMMGDQLQMILQQPGEPVQRDRLTLPDDLLVVDAGFDELIRSHWETLVAGDDLTFYFASVARFDLIRFRVERVSNSDQGKVVIRMQLASRLLAWLLDPIQLEYDAESRRLLSYRGLTNIRSASGDNYIASITYFYP